MKNIHILPTDKPSRLYKSEGTGELEILSNYSVSNEGSGINIYITNDEEIKEGDWYFDCVANVINTSKTTGKYKIYKKIILTTDFRLAPDVQKIDDEFLEWFVKNPSCEEADIEIKSTLDKVDGHYHDLWEIIIPKEPTLSEKLEKIVSKESSKFVEESNERFRIREEKKLKEAFDEIYKSIDFTEFDFASFKLGVKWEQERNK